MRLNADGSVDPAFRASVGLAQRFSRVIALPGGAVLGLSAGILWRLDDDGTARMLAPGRLSSVTDVQAAPGDRLIVALEDEGGWRLQRWTPDGEVDPAFACALDRAGTSGGPGTFARRLSPERDKAMVITLPDSGPAALGAPSAYLEPGDVLLAMQELGKPERRLDGVGVNDVRALMEGPAGSVATFEIERPGKPGTPATTLRLTIRRRPDTTSVRHERPRGRPREARTVIAVQGDGKVLVAREKGLDVEVIRLLEDGRIDTMFTRVPKPLATNELDARHAHKSVVEDHPESTSPQSFTTLFATAWSYEFDPPAVVALAPAANGRTLAALSDGHVVRLEPDGALDLAFHVRFSGLVRDLLPLGDGGAIVVRDYLAPDAPPFPFAGGPKGGIVYVDKRGKPVRK